MPQDQPVLRGRRARLELLDLQDLLALKVILAKKVKKARLAQQDQPGLLDPRVLKETQATKAKKVK